MSFNRLVYDGCAYKANLSENVSQLSYLLDPIKYNNCHECRPELGVVGGTNVSLVAGNLVDLESSLFNIDRPITHCDAKKWIPRSDGYIQSKPGNKPECPVKTDVNLKHLRPCQYVNYRKTPMSEEPQLFSCPR